MLREEGSGAVRERKEAEKEKKKDIYLYTGKGGRVGGAWASPTALCHHPALG